MFVERDAAERSDAAPSGPPADLAAEAAQGTAGTEPLPASDSAEREGLGGEEPAGKKWSTVELGFFARSEALAEQEASSEEPAPVGVREAFVRRAASLPPKTKVAAGFALVTLLITGGVWAAREPSGSGAASAGRAARTSAPVSTGVPGRSDGLPSRRDLVALVPTRASAAAPPTSEAPRPAAESRPARITGARDRVAASPARAKAKAKAKGRPRSTPDKRRLRARR